MKEMEGSTGVDRKADIKQEGGEIVTFKDLPIGNHDDDQLGSKKYSEGLAKFIGFCNTPMTIALQGDWGSGKTSLMQMIRRKIEPDKNIHTVWFNTWQYSQFGSEDNLPVNLLECLVRKITEIKDTEGKAADKAVEKRIFRYVKYLKCLKVPLTIAGVGSIGGKPLDTAIDAISAGMETAASVMENRREEELQAEENLSVSEIISTLKEDLQAWVDKKMKSSAHGNGRIVIFIDDLDRLEPVRAIELLEILKLYMDLEHCVYVLAVDYEVVVRGVKEKYGQDFSEKKGQAFFEKIIQLPFKMPVEEYDIDGYADMMLKTMRVKLHNQPAGLVFIKKAAEGNPRALKRLFNVFSLMRTIKSGDGDNQNGIRDDMILGTLCLQFCSEKLYSLINSIQNHIETDTMQYLANTSYEELIQDKMYGEVLKRININREFWEENKILFKDFDQLINNMDDEGIEQLKETLSASNLVSSGKGSRRKNTEFESKPRIFNASEEIRKIKEINDGIGLDQCKFLSFKLGGDPDYTEVRNGNDLLQKALGIIYKKDADRFKGMLEHLEEKALITLFHGTEGAGIVQKGVIEGTNIDIEMKNGAGRKIELISLVMKTLKMDPSDFNYKVKLKQYQK